jgi:acyl-coenzyme A thioesterase PaaI-like protein
MTKQQAVPTDLTPEEMVWWDKGWRPHSEVPFIGLIGPIWERADGEAGRFGFLAQPKHRNRREVVHGGMLMAFADRALGLTSRRANDDQPQATVQIDFQLLDAVQVGDFVEATCLVSRKTRFLMFMSGTLTVGPKVVVTVTGIWKTLKSNPPV